MDERLLKRAVQSIEMPEDMKDRIIANCKSSETKPLFLPKKRLAYLPMAVTACVCVLVVALAGVGIWQLRVLSEEPPSLTSDGTGAAEPQEDVIHVIPLSDEDLDTRTDAYKSGYSEEVDDIDNLVTMTEEEINEYYGIETAYLLNSLNIKLTPINPAEVDGLTCSYVFRTDGGAGEVYFDTNAFIYGEDGEICVYISKFAIPHSIPKLWSDKEQLSTISGVTAAVGMREGNGWKQYRTEFKLEEYGLYFNVWCDYDMIGKVVGAIKTHCDKLFSLDVPGDPAKITVDDVNECLNIIDKNSDFTAVDSDIYDIDFDGSNEVLVLADVPFRAVCVFKKENGKMVQTDTIGMGALADVETLKLHTYSDHDEEYPYFIFHFDNGGVMKCDVVAAIKRVNGSYDIEYLLSFGTLNYTDIPEPFTKEFYRIGWNKNDVAMDGDYNDISKEEFLRIYEKYMTAKPLTLEKLKEICSGNTSKLTWSDFEQFEAAEIGSGLYIMRYPIEDKYSLTIGGVPDEDPWYMRFRTEGQYYDIDIREESLEEYLNDPIPEGDFVNIIPLKEDEINYFMSADFAEEDRVYMTDEELSEYYGIDVTAFGNIPSYMEAQSYEHNDGMRCIWWKDSDGSGLYYDKNTFSFVNPNGTEAIEISLGRLMVSNDKLWEKMKMRSRIGGRDVVIGKTEQEHYIAELRSKDGEIGFLVSAFGGVSFDEFRGVISALVEQTEDRQHRYFGKYDDENIHFICAEYSEDMNDDLWWSLMGPGEQPSSLLYEDFAAMSREELIEYYGVNIFPDALSSEKYELNEGGENGFGVYRQNGGKGEVYFDTNSFRYSGRTNNFICIDVGKNGLPYKTKLIEEMMCDPNYLSYVNGHPVLFMYDDYGNEFAIFMTASGKVGFRIAANNIGFGAVNTTNLVEIVSQLIGQ